MISEDNRQIALTASNRTNGSRCEFDVSDTLRLFLIGYTKSFPTYLPDRTPSSPAMSAAAAAAAATKTLRRPLKYLDPTETLEIGHGLSLTPRLKLLLTFFRADQTVRPLDEWKLKQALLSFIRSPPLSLSQVPDDDLLLHRLPDLHKRKRDEAIATGTLYVRDLSFLKRTDRESADRENGEDEALRKKYLDWRGSVVERLSGIELNIEGVKFKMTLEVPVSDDFENMKKSWKEFYVFKSDKSSKE